MDETEKMSAGASDVAIEAEARTRIARAASLLVVTGAGVSAESGVPTFRGADGLWKNARPEDIATPEAFERDPRHVWEWYAWRRERIAPLTPNPAHLAIAASDARVRGFLLATQNVDGLHGRAGSRRLIELHGNLWRIRCTACRRVWEDLRVPLPELPPRCRCGALARPDVVWFGEPLPTQALEQGFRHAKAADVVLVAGTSSLVYPAAALPQVARAAGAYVVEVNPEVTPLTPLSDVSLRGLAGELLPRLLGGES